MKQSLKCKPETTLMNILQFSSHSLNTGFPKECHVEIQRQSICSKNDALLMLCQKYKASVSKKYCNKDNQPKYI